MTSQDSSNKRNLTPHILMACFIALALTVASVQVLAWHRYIGWDAVQYLDIADQILMGHWNELFRTYWSPLFPVLLAVFKLIAGRDANELVLLNCAVYLCFVFLMFAFLHFAKNLLAVQKQLTADEEGRFVSLSPTQLTIGMYACFLFSALAVTELTYKTPDMLSSGICMLVLSQCLRLLAGGDTSARCVTTGFLMGLACWAKNMNVGFSSVLAVMLVIEGRRKNILSWKKLSILVATFAIVIGALVVPNSLQAGRLTFSDVAHIGRSWTEMCGHLVNVHARESTFTHPTRILTDEPRVYEFATPFEVTYPPCYAPQYWYEGVQLHLSAKKYFGALELKLITIFRVLLGVLLFATAVCAIAARGIPLSVERLINYASGWVPCMAVIAVCIFFADFLGRYWTPYLIGALCFYLACLRLPDSTRARKALNFSFVVLVIWMMGCLLGKSFFHMYFAFPNFAQAFMKMADVKGPASPPESVHLKIIEELKRIGLKPGDRVARITRLGGGDAEIYWAKATRLRIICESIDVDGFWASSSEQRQVVYKKFKELGVKAVVQDWAAGFREYPVPTDPGWTLMPGTKSYVYILD